jgi:hypothetical protein
MVRAKRCMIDPLSHTNRVPAQSPSPERPLWAERARLIAGNALVALFAMEIGACGHPAARPVTPVGAPRPTAGAVATLAGPSGSKELALQAAPTAPPLPSTASSEELAAPRFAPVFRSANAVAKKDLSWSACTQTLGPRGKDVAKDLFATASGCAKATGMRPLGAVITGTQSDSDNPQSYLLDAKAHHCYRVYAMGDGAIKSLEIAIKDSTGAISGQGSNAAGAAMVSGDDTVCFKDDDAASVVVSVGMGGGSYALQIWGD